MAVWPDCLNTNLPKRPNTSFHASCWSYIISLFAKRLPDIATVLSVITHFVSLSPQANIFYAPRCVSHIIHQSYAPYVTRSSSIFRWRYWSILLWLDNTDTNVYPHECKDNLISFRGVPWDCTDSLSFIIKYVSSATGWRHCHFCEKFTQAPIPTAALMYHILITRP